MFRSPNSWLCLGVFDFQLCIRIWNVFKHRIFINLLVRFDWRLPEKKTSKIYGKHFATKISREIQCQWVCSNQLWSINLHSSRVGSRCFVLWKFFSYQRPHRKRKTWNKLCGCWCRFDGLVKISHIAASNNLELVTETLTRHIKKRVNFLTNDKEVTCLPSKSSEFHLLRTARLELGWGIPTSSLTKQCAWIPLWYPSLQWRMKLLWDDKSMERFT